MKLATVLAQLFLIGFHKGTAFVPIYYRAQWHVQNQQGLAFAAVQGMAQADNNLDATMEQATVHEIPGPFPGTKVTLIGTAHLSKQSNEQVDRIIEKVRPDVVAVELDENRLQRIGFSSFADIGIETVVTASDIEVPSNNNSNKPNEPWWKLPQVVGRDLALNLIAQTARKMLTGMYDGASQTLGNKAGGEFLAAIEACKKYNVQKLVLADQDSTETIKRTAALALDSGDFFGFLSRLEQVNEEELSVLKARVMNDILDEDQKNDEAAFTMAMMEELKADTSFRTRLFDRLEKEVPEFTTTFVKERDYIMSEAIRREVVDNGAKHVVGVVGLAHVDGMKNNLQEIFSSTN